MWTIVSRVTGVLRGITIAAVLGATYFANTYQFTNSLPNLIFYGLLAGSLFSSLLVPALVPHIDSGDRRRGRAHRWRAARGGAGRHAGPRPGRRGAHAVAAAAGLDRRHRRGRAQARPHVGAILVLLLLPQVPLYAVVGTATAVMNAHRRFALAAAAPALENLGTIAVLGVVAVLYARAAIKRQVPLSLLLLLGLGTTGAVLLHASVQWWGARRVGVVLLPEAGWHDPQVRAVIRRALPAVAQAALARAAAGGAAGGRRPGGRRRGGLPAGDELLLPADRRRRDAGRAVAGAAAVPDDRAGPGAAVPRHLRAGLAFAAFLVMPAATAYAVLRRPLAAAIAFGRFGAAGGVDLLAASLLGLAPGIIGETLFLVTTYACYARQDTTHPAARHDHPDGRLRGGVIAVSLSCTARLC